jgi:hypothetical protein
MPHRDNIMRRDGCRNPRHTRIVMVTEIRQSSEADGCPPAGTIVLIRQAPKGAIL